jgi:hypothetical protein
LPALLLQQQSQRQPQQQSGYGRNSLQEQQSNGTRALIILAVGAKTRRNWTRSKSICFYRENRHGQNPHVFAGKIDMVEIQFFIGKIVMVKINMFL